MDYVIGIDAGGTYFRVKAVALDGKTLGEVTVSSLGYYSECTDAFMKGVGDAVAACLASFSGNLSDCRSIVAGVSGIDSEEDRISLEECLSSHFGCKALCMNDAELANEGINDGVGILLNSGTGSIAFGTNEAGLHCRVGGWPLKVMGDEGSGAWVALKTVRLTAKWFDQIIGDSVLVDSFMKNFGITGQKTYMDFCLNYTSDQLAEIGPLVGEAVKAGDPYASEILEEAANESFLLVRNLATRLGYGPEDSFKVGLWGSNILKSEYHLEKFKEYLKEGYPNARLGYTDISLLDIACNTAIGTCKGLA